ncbi:hypothetical protein DPMN_186923 [Dreissena polymorpha]|uniref:Uncharacterized protein n=1 Tax=Dreissena polymorpha TaxID=45954 RepID=A0A9D4IA02_DREPO|nr:hypothetical protein DPMN_186923 [Dreissena polymorpha]
MACSIRSRKLQIDFILAQQRFKASINKANCTLDILDNYTDTISNTINSKSKNASYILKTLRNTSRPGSDIYNYSLQPDPSLLQNEPEADDKSPSILKEDVVDALRSLKAGQSPVREWIMCLQNWGQLKEVEQTY